MEVNIQKQNLLEQALILKEIELEAYKTLNEQHGNMTSHIDEKSEAVVAVEIGILKREIDAIKKKNFPNGICNWCSTELKDGNFVFAVAGSGSPFSYCNEGCKNLHEDMMIKKAENKNG